MTGRIAVIAVGALAQALAWRVIVAARGSVWRVMPPTLIAIGAAALVVGDPALASDMALASVAAVGVVTGVVLYLATVAFVARASGWWRFRDHVTEVYRRADDVPRRTAVVLSLAMVAGEELFWRGLVQPTLSRGVGLAGAVLAWLAFVAVNAASERLPIIAAAAVGGAVWAALAFVTGGIAASATCHAAWTVLMIVRPPAAARAERW
jgi:membrane protease YdiL (CAAX protease family)